MVEEVGELELEDELPEGKLQEFKGCEESEDDRKDALATLYRVRGLGMHKEEGSPDRRVVSLREGPN
jgi:hypothetical protein